MSDVRRVKAGTTDVSVNLRIADSTDGTPETGVVFNTSGIDIWYRRELAASVDITEATLAALTTAHADGGFLHINDGVYRLDLPDAAVAAGATGVQIGGTVTGMVVYGPYIELVAYDPYDTVRLGLTALPNAAAEASGGLYTRGSGAGQIAQTANGIVSVNSARLNDSATAATNLSTAALVEVPATVTNAGFSPTTSEFETATITEATASHFVGRIVIFTSGALLYQQSLITAYSLVGGRGHFTVSTMTDAPGNGDTFLVL